MITVKLPRAYYYAGRVDTSELEAVLKQGLWSMTGVEPADVARDEVAKGLIEFLDGETDIDNPFKQFELTGFYDFIAAGKIPGVKLE